LSALSYSHSRKRWRSVFAAPNPAATSAATAAG
jgi:hypothetical protein